MESYAAFIRAYRIIKLYTVSEIYLDIAFVVYPRYFKCKYPVRFDKSLYDFSFFKFGVFIIGFLDR